MRAGTGMGGHQSLNRAALLRPSTGPLLSNQAGPSEALEEMGQVVTEFERVGHGNDPLVVCVAVGSVCFKI